MDYQARLNDILEKVRKGGVYDVMPEYERQSDYLDTDEAQEVITALFLESVGEDGTRWSYSAPMEMPVDMHREGLHRQIGSNQRAYDIRRKWQTNQEDGE